MNGRARIYPTSSRLSSPYVAALVLIEDVELLEQLKNDAELKAVRKARKEKGGVTSKQYRKKHGL